MVTAHFLRVSGGSCWSTHRAAPTIWWGPLRVLVKLDVVSQDIWFHEVFEFSMHLGTDKDSPRG